jgi:hypothetical protein
VLFDASHSLREALRIASTTIPRDASYDCVAENDLDTTAFTLHASLNDLNWQLLTTQVKDGRLMPSDDRRRFNAADTRLPDYLVLFAPGTNDQRYARHYQSAQEQVERADAVLSAMRGYTNIVRRTTGGGTHNLTIYRRQ